MVYRKSPEWENIYRKAEGYFSEKAAIHHYRGIAKNTYITCLQGENIMYKKYFYALRPLLACRYIERYHCPPPVLFDELMELNLPKELRKGIEELLEMKKTTGEKELKPRIPVISKFIAAELERQKEIADSLKYEHLKKWDVLNNIFIQTVCS